MLLAVSVALAACSLLPGASEKDSTNAAVQEQPRVALELIGVEGDLADNVRAHVSITTKPCNTSSAYLKVLGKRAEGEALEALQAFGYYAPKITSDVVVGTECPLARIVVDRGAAVLLRTIDLEIRGPGSDDQEFNERLQAIKLEPGDQLDHGEYTKAKRLIKSVALERGYLDGTFLRRELKVDPIHLAADITLIFATGPRYSLGEVDIEQTPNFIDETVVRRFIEDPSGAPYTAAAVGSLHRALSHSNYFHSIEVRPRLSAPLGETIPVDIKLTPRDRHAFNAGIGASTDEGIRGRVGYQNRRVNRRGHQFDFNVNASLIEQEFSSAYRIPLTHPTDEWLTAQIGVRRRDVDAFETTEAQLMVSETKRRLWGWMETRFVELSRENYTLSGTNEVSNFLAPGINWHRTVANHDLFPTRGYDIDFELKGAAEAVVSDTSFARALLNLTTIYGLPFDSRALLRASLGAIWVDAFRALPPSARFFVGGDNSLRGYDIDSRGPVDANNEVIGGTYLAVASAELEHYFTAAWGAAVFVDIGNAFGGDGSSSGLLTGAGIGLRWRSPVGPMRLDIAHPLDEASDAFRIHLRIGPDL